MENEMRTLVLQLGDAWASERHQPRNSNCRSLRCMGGGGSIDVTDMARRACASASLKLAAFTEWIFLVRPRAEERTAYAAAIK